MEERVDSPTALSPNGETRPRGGRIARAANLVLESLVGDGVAEIDPQSPEGQEMLRQVLETPEY